MKLKIAEFLLEVVEFLGVYYAGYAAGKGWDFIWSFIFIAISILADSLREKK